MTDDELGRRAAQQGRRPRRRPVDAQPVEAEAPDREPLHPLGRDGVLRGGVGHRRVEGRVERRDLGQGRPRLRHGVDRGQLGRQVQRIEREQLPQPRADIAGDEDGLPEARAAVDHPMPDGVDRACGPERGHHLRVARAGVARFVLRHDRRPALAVEDAPLERARAGVQHQEAPQWGHFQSFTSGMSSPCVSDLGLVLDELVHQLLANVSGPRGRASAPARRRP